MDDGLTYEQLQAMGAKPSGGPAPADEGLTFEQLQQMGAKPSAPAPAAPPEMSRGERVGQGMAAVNSGVDRMLFGIPSMLLRGAAKIDHATGMEEPGWAENAANGIEEYRNRNPRLSTATDMPAYLSGAGEAKAVENLAEPAFRSIGGPAAIAKGVEQLLPASATPLARAGRSVVTGAGTNAVLSEAESAMNGSTLGEAAGKAAGSALIGGALGGGFGLLGSAAEGTLGSKGAKARRYIEDRGGTVSATSPGKGPIYDSMDVGGNNAADIGEQARKSGERVEKGMNDYKRQAASEPYEREVGKIGPEKANARVVEMDQILGDLHEAARTEQDPIIRHQLEDQIDTIERTATVDVGKASLPYRDAPQAGKPIYSEKELNDLRQVMGDKGKVGQSNKASLAPLREATSKVKAEVDHGPYAPANKAFHEGMNDYEESLNLLDMKKNKKSGPNEANIKKASIKGQRRGQNTVTAGAERSRLDAFTAKHPELGLELERPELLRKQADLQFNAGGAGGHANLIDVAKHNVIPAAFSLMLQQAGLGKAAWLTMAAHMAAKNSQPIAARLLYNPALMAEAASKLPKSLLFQAARKGNE